MSFDILNKDGDPVFIFLCDHASNALPAAYGNLGVREDEFKRHIAWDIGAGPVTRALSDRFKSPAIVANYSRLLIDLNRGVDDPTLIMKLSDGAIVPGNHHVDADEVQKRVEEYYLPYHQAIDDAIDGALAQGQVPALVSIHSFTESWKDLRRPWHVGILWDRDNRMSEPLIRHFSEDPDMIVGDNQPYTGELAGDTCYTHGTLRGVPHALLEIRQDLISDEVGVLSWVDRLERALHHMRENHDIWFLHEFGSHSH